MRLEKQILKKFKQRLTSAFYPEKQPPGSCPGIFFFFLLICEFLDVLFQNQPKLSPRNNFQRTFSRITFLNPLSIVDDVSSYIVCTQSISSTRTVLYLKKLWTETNLSNKHLTWRTLHILRLNSWKCFKNTIKTHCLLFWRAFDNIIVQKTKESICLILI